MSYNRIIYTHSSTPPPRGRPLALRPGRFLRRAPVRSGRVAIGDGGLLALALALAGDGLGGGGVPVVDHLGGEHGVEGEAGDEAVEDHLVVDLLDGGEDAGEGAEEVVEDLCVVLACA